MNTNVTLITALVAGFFSFMSPCILPLIPGYISFISGTTLSEMQNKQNQKRIIFYSVYFIIGFSFVFILLGATATYIGSFLLMYKDIFNKIAGVIIIILGLHVAGVVKVRFLNVEKRIHVTGLKTSPWSAIIIGMAFAFGWTPCIGPWLAPILALAANEQTVSRGIILLTMYSIGLGIPFFLTALVVDKYFLVFNKIKKYFKQIEITAGILLILLGILIFTGQLSKVAYLFV